MLLVIHGENSTEIIFTWLPINQMVGNANKCQLITNQKKNLLSLKIGNDRLVNRETVKVLGITFDNHLTFKIINMQKMEMKISKILPKSFQNQISILKSQILCTQTNF